MKKQAIEQQIHALKRDIKLLKIIVHKKGTSAAERAYKELFASG